MRNRSKVRLNLEVSEAVRDRLDGLKDRSGAESLTEVIRRALAVYDHLVLHSQAGGSVVLINSDGSREKLVLAL